MNPGPLDAAAPSRARGNLVRRRLLLATLGLAVAAPGLFGPGAHARLWRVERDGSGDYSTIQPAIDAAAPGDTIQLGPGRYTETTSTSFPGFTVQSHAVVEKGPLTFLARAPGQSIIGPTGRHDVGLGPHGMSVSATAAGITVDGLVIENVFDGIYALHGLTIRASTFRGSFHGVSAFAVVNLAIRASQFEANDRAVSIGPNAVSPEISRSAFLGNISHAVAFIACANAFVDSCAIEGPGTGVTIQQGSWGRIERSTISSTARPAVDIAIDAIASVTESRLLAGTWTLAVSARSTAFVTRSVIKGGLYASAYFSGQSSVAIEQSDILGSGAWTAQADDYITDPVVHLNLKNNYWGTASSSLVASWIHDGVDDPSIKAIIDFEPILVTPVASTQTSMGALKGRFRRQ